jgi:hypothetical protein
MFVTTKEQKQLLSRTIKDRQKSREETFFFYHRKAREVMWGNNTELTENMIAWRKQRKEGTLMIQPCNNRTKIIQGKTWYILVVQQLTDGIMDDIGIDPLGIGFDEGAYLVTGLIYVFKHEANRDATYKYVMGLPKDK